MNLDRVSAVIRPRTYAESVDLGFQMLRAWWRPVLGAWLVVGVPVFAVLAATLYRWPAAALLLLWWSKPVFARVPLFVLSRGLFGALPGLGQTLRAWPGEARPGLLAALTWRRLDMARSLRAPIVQLERLSGKAARRRLRIVSRDARLEALTLMLTCAVFELCVFSGLVLALMAFFPVPELKAFFTEDSGSLPLLDRWILVAFYAMAASFIEPFHVAGGFGLYLNRRTHLEGWDIEVVFRRMAARLRRAGTATAASALLLVALALVGAGVLGAPAGAAEPEPGVDPDPGRIVKEVLADPIFGTETTETRWEWKTREPESSSDSAAFEELGALFAAVFRALAWVLGGLGLTWGLFEVARRARMPRVPREAETAQAPPVEVLGLDVRREALPRNLAERASELWTAGRRRDALRLLYRGTLSRLISHHRLPLTAGATEGDCLRLAEPRLALDRLNYLRSLTSMWLVTAYGHRDPDEAQGLALIRGWSAHFGDAP